MGFIFSPKASDGLTTTCQLLMTLLSTIKKSHKIICCFPRNRREFSCEISQRNSDRLLRKQQKPQRITFCHTLHTSQLAVLPRDAMRIRAVLAIGTRGVKFFRLIYLITFVPRTTKFGRITHVGEGRQPQAPPQRAGPSAPHFWDILIFMRTPFLRRTTKFNVVTHTGTGCF